MPVNKKLWFVTILKHEIWLQTYLTTRWLLPKNTLFNQKFPFGRLSSTGVESPFFKISCLFFKNQNTIAGKPNVKINYNEPSVKLKLLGLPHLCQQWPRTSFSNKVQFHVISLVNFWDSNIIVIWFYGIY